METRIVTVEELTTSHVIVKGDKLIFIRAINRTDSHIQFRISNTQRNYTYPIGTKIRVKA